MDEMTKRERVEAAINGESMDRVPICYYNHRHEVEAFPDKLIKAMIEQNETFDWDFIKVMLRASYYMEAWGCTYEFDPVKGPILQDYAVKKAEDYKTLSKLDPSTGPFGEQVEVARKLAKPSRAAPLTSRAFFLPSQSRAGSPAASSALKTRPRQ